MFQKHKKKHTKQRKNAPMMRQKEEKSHKIVAKHNESAQNGTKTVQLAPKTASERRKAGPNTSKTQHAQRGV